MERKRDRDLMGGIPAGTWVALSADESFVVDTGLTYQEAVAAAHEKGEDDPVIAISQEQDGFRRFLSGSSL